MSDFPVPSAAGECNLFKTEVPSSLADAEVRELLGLALRAEMALLSQYVYLLATLPGRNEMRDFADAEIIGAIARVLHDLATGEMRHLGSVCNFLVAWGGKPDFASGVVGYADRPAAADACGFHLEAMSRGYIAELLGYETRESNLRIPVHVDVLDTDPTKRKASESIGRIYRRIYFETCMRQGSWTVEPTAGWRMVCIAFEGKETRGGGVRVLQPAPDPRGIVTRLLNGLMFTMTEGEGAAEDDQNPLTHVNRLKTIAQNWAVLSALSAVPTRTMLADPRIAYIASPYAQALAIAVARAYEAALASLYLLWLDSSADPSGDMPLFQRIGGFMSCLLGSLATLLAQTPVDSDGAPPRYAGPTFELIEEVAVPDKRASAVDQALAKLDVLAGAVADALTKRTATPYTIDADRHVPALRRRLDDIGHYRRYIERLAAGAPA